MFVSKGREISKSITASTDQIGPDLQVTCAVPSIHSGTVCSGPAYLERRVMCTLTDFMATCQWVTEIHLDL